MSFENLHDDLEEIVEQYGTSEHTDVTARACSSDRFSGVEYVLTSNSAIDVVAVVNALREYDTLFAESISAAPEGEGSRLVVFVTEIDLNEDTALISEALS